METYGKTSQVPAKLKGHLVKTTRDRWDYVSDEVIDLFSTSEQAWQSYLDNRPSPKVTAKLAKGNKAEEPQGGRLGLVPKTVDTLVSIQHNTTFSNNEGFFDATPLNPRALETKPLYEASLKQRMSERNLLSTLRELRLCAVLDGTAVAYVRHAHEINTRIQYDEATTLQMNPEDPYGEPLQVPTGEVTESSLEEVVYDGGDVSVVPFEDWRVEPYAPSFKEAYFLRRMWVTLDKLKKMFPNVPKELAVSYQTSKDNGHLYNNKEFYAGLTGQNKSKHLSSDKRDGRDRALVVFHYDDFYIDGVSYPNHLCVIINDLECIWFGRNPHNHGCKPYVLTPYHSVPNQLYGVSGVKHVLPNSEIVDAIWNIMYTNARWGSAPVFLSDITDPVQTQNKDLVMKPGSRIPVSRQGSISQLPINLSNIAYLGEVMKEATLNVKEVSGATDYMTGAVANKSHVSAYETDIRGENGSSRFQTVMDSFNTCILEPLLNQFYENDRQYKITDEFVEGSILSPEDIKLSLFKFNTVSAQAALSKNKRVNQLFELLNTIIPTAQGLGVGAPKRQSIEFNVYSIIQQLMAEGGMTFTGNFVTGRDLTADEIKQEQQMQALMLATGGGETGE